MEYEFDGHTYELTKLGLGDAKECILRLTKLGMFSGEGIKIESVVQKLSMADLKFFEEKLFGKHMHLINDEGNPVPLGRAIADKHFDGRLGAYLHMIVRALIFNFSSFLAELHIEELVGGLQPPE